jgi:hypothetical protein
MLIVVILVIILRLLHKDVVGVTGCRASRHTGHRMNVLC